MPTGYTSFIESGKVKDAKQFLHLCLRAFGILSFMRDDSLDLADDYTSGIIENHEKNVKYHQDKLDSARKEITRLQSISDDELYEMFSKQENSNTDYYAKALQNNEVYDRIAGEIQAWDCDRELEGLKEFALDQIRKSKNIVHTTDNVHTSKEEFLKEHKDSFLADLNHDAQWDIDYHTKELQREDECFAERIAYYNKVKEELKKLK